ncbi:unnamed protein product [Periconia digitata]|uniref:Structure-specific endonuclease subunit SLX4 n=1 Tax=Periconia digitata TaxID=1303443 RepID=A0A9W4UMT0_9PLEO|nr:unnamed protein product [Periconia digitata]
MSAKTLDLLVLSSSPPTSSPPNRNKPIVPSGTPPPSQFRRAISTFSYSPPPSAQRNDKKKQSALVSGSRAAAIPESAARGFMSARSLVGELGALEDEGRAAGDKETVEEPPKRAVKARRKRVNKDEAMVDEQDVIENSGAIEAPKPKRRARKNKEEGEVAPKCTRKKKAEVEEPAYVAPAHFGGAASIDITTEAIDAAGLRPEEVAAEEGSAAQELKEKEPKVGRPRKPRAKKADHVEGDSIDAATNNTVIESPDVICLGPETNMEKVASAAPDVKAKEPKVTRPRKPRAKKADHLEGDEGAAAAAPKKSRITKPRTTKAKRKSEEVVSAHFQKEIEEKAMKETLTEASATELISSAQRAKADDDPIWNIPSSPNIKDIRPPRHRPPDPVHEPLELDEAIARRLQWTPPKNTTAQVIDLGSSSKENTPAAPDAANSGFTSLLSGFSYAHPQPIPDLAPSTIFAPEVRTLTKRRRFELIEVPEIQPASRQSSPEKGKAPKKKARTITDLVTEQYAPKSAEPQPATVTSNFFSPRPTTTTSTTTITTTTKLPLNDTTNTSTVKPARKKRATSKPSSENGEKKKKPRAKSSKAAAKPAKPKLVMEKLLSPSSAALKMSKQDILFGTSSQLALEESPTIVRQIQQAMIESEQDAELLHHFGDGAPSAVRLWPRLTRIDGKRGLWNASSRDEVGDLLENQNDVYLPEPDRTQDIPLLLDGSLDDASSPFVNIDDLPPPPPPDAPDAPVIQLSSDLPTPPETVPDEPIAADVYADEALHDSSFAHIDDFFQEPPPSNQNVQSSFAHIDDFSPPASYVNHSPPRTLSASLRNSSPKRRPGRPTKHVSAIPRTSASTSAEVIHKPLPRPAPSSMAAPTTPSRPNRFLHIEEILDSEDDEALSPTPPRTRRLVDSPPLPLFSLPSAARPTKASASPIPKAKSKAQTRSVTDKAAAEPSTPVHRIPATHLTFEAVKPTLFPAITALIRALPPTTDPTRPSWHEKILMYDPLPLEEFTTFLNTHQRCRTYKKATIKQVKAWEKLLKSKGENVDSPDIDVEDEHMVKAVEKELESWMVQKWCEESSVCCFSTKEKGKNSGGARRGLY